MILLHHDNNELTVLAEHAEAWRRFMAAAGAATSEEASRPEDDELPTCDPATTGLTQEEVRSAMKRVRKGNGVAIEAYEASPAAQAALVELIQHIWADQSSKQTDCSDASVPDSRDSYPAAASKRSCPVCPTRPKQQASRLQRGKRSSLLTPAAPTPLRQASVAAPSV